MGTDTAMWARHPDPPSIMHNRGLADPQVRIFTSERTSQSPIIHNTLKSFVYLSLLQNRPNKLQIRKCRKSLQIKAKHF